MLDPLAFAAAAAASGGLQYPYFLPSLLSQTSGTNNNYPFSTLSSSLMNPSATLYPFLSPDWFTSSSKFMDGYTGLTSDKSSSNFPIHFVLKHFFLLLDSKESTSNQTVNKILFNKNISFLLQSKSKHITSENKHLPSLNSLLNESSSKVGNRNP
jgi:hypothetical protein